ncbi:MAG TPA: hypothetical protein VHG90_09490 [Acidimicrobiales bacterium]|nr:hypothetical protein [Acidimicrobiales bacterium]
MTRQQRERSLMSRPPIRRVLAAVALGTVGRALWHLTLDAFVLYVFGDPGRERRERSVAASGADDTPPRPVV